MTSDDTDKLIEGLPPEIKKKYNLYTKAERIINDLLESLKEATL
jgi:hypothetical protein